MIAWFLICFQGDQLKVKLANHKFSKILDGPKFLVFGVCLVIGGRDYIVQTVGLCAYAYSTCIHTNDYYINSYPYAVSNGA